MLHDIKNSDFISLLNKSQLSKTNTVFWLHSNITVLILVVSAVIINLNNYVGDPIDCISNKDKEGAVKFSDNFCWIYGTTTKKDGDVETHEYYQWIALTLIAQAVCFYIPGWLWSYWEKGHIKEVVGDNGIKILDDILVKSEDRCEEIAVEISKKIVDNMGSHKHWAAKFLFCEILNVFTTISQMFFTDYFLNKKFIKYPFKMIDYVVEASEEDNPMEQTFPILTECVQYPYSIGFSNNKIELKCVLPANIWNQKLYLFLCFWWWFLAILGAFQLTFRLLTLVSRQFRNKLETWNGRKSYWSNYSDWLFYRFVLKNCNPILLKDIRANILEESGELGQQTIIEKTPLD